MRYLAGLRTMPAYCASLLAAPAYLVLMLVALGIFVAMSRDRARPHHGR